MIIRAPRVVLERDLWQESQNIVVMLHFTITQKQKESSLMNIVIVLKQLSAVFLEEIHCKNPKEIVK